MARKTPNSAGRIPDDVPLILASISPRRKTLLKSLKIPFRIIPSHVPENCREKNPQKLVAKLALRKARGVSRRCPQALVLGADTIVVCRKTIIGKPKNKKDSMRILSLLNNRWQQVYTGIALVCQGGNKYWTKSVKSSVLARNLSPRELTRLSGKHPDKAGAYAVQDKHDPFIKRIAGDYTNVVGLPLDATKRLIQKGRAWLLKHCAPPAPKAGKNKNKPLVDERPRRRSCLRAAR